MTVVSEVLVMSWITERLDDSEDYMLKKQHVRSEPRLRTGAHAVMIAGECHRTYGYARDLSRSGMQIRTFSLCESWPKPVGEDIRLEFSLPDKGVSFSCRAKVVWSRANDDIGSVSLQGVRFEEIDPAVQSRIGELAATVN